MKHKKKLLRIIFGRTAIVVLALLLQIYLLVVGVMKLQEYSVFWYATFTLLGFISILVIVNSDDDPSFKLAWIIPVCVIPVFGTVLYVFVRLQFGTKMIAGRLRALLKETRPLLAQEEAVMGELADNAPQACHLASYMNRCGGYPTYRNTYVKYFPLGEDKFAELVKQLESAREFIFMEYFIVEEGRMWNTILDVLKRKAQEGVEVRMMYDGMCSLMLLPYSYPKKLEAMGIRCKMFSPIKPALSTHQNNRDHRKITIIDGVTAFTGGVNLADEYINEVVRFGHWKDTAIMLQGEAVRGFTVMFLQMWNVTERVPEHYEKYVKTEFNLPGVLPACGFVMPYGDSPLDTEAVGEAVYMDILYTARKYVHIMTPYLILDGEMTQALTYAAKRGIEVIIIMPHIPDKVYAYLLARSHYPQLLKAGVKIYEYTPGFVHAKVFASDDEKAVVGSINLDFRSLYLHFECAAYIYKSPVVADVEADFQDTLLKCQEITLEDCRRYHPVKKLAGSVLKLFAPLM